MVQMQVQQMQMMMFNLKMRLVISQREDKKTATLTSPEKNVSIFKLPKTVVKTLLTTDNNNASDTQITVRRQFVGTTTTGGVVSFTAGSNETFVAFAEKDYTMSVLTAGDGSGSQGDIVSVSGKTFWNRNSNSNSYR